MSIVKNSNYGWYISHENLIKEIYAQVDDNSTSFQLKPELFKIITAYKPTKSTKNKPPSNLQDDSFEKEAQHVQDFYNRLYDEIGEVFAKTGLEVRNDDALKTATEAYTESGKAPVTDMYGYNSDGAIAKKLENARFLFPPNCKFYCKDVADMTHYLTDQKYDLVMLDPPWWNKYIRRKRKHSDQGYNMMFNEQLKNVPLENHLNDDSLVVVWCTNSSQHLNALRDEIFPKWGVKYVGKWYWVKITQSGEVVCPFSKPPRKQPFEQIIFAAKEERAFPNPPCDKLVVSIPSSLHSHKPPLTRLLESFLPSKPACLEVFARYLLPDWTSYGNEVLRFQHESLYVRVSG